MFTCMPKAITLKSQPQKLFKQTNNSSATPTLWGWRLKDKNHRVIPSRETADQRVSSALFQLYFNSLNQFCEVSVNCFSSR